MTVGTAITTTPADVIEAILPYEPDDGHKGTFLILRIAGLDRRLALRLVNRKYRSWQNWRATDEDFYRLDEAMPFLTAKFGGEARVVRTALLDISVIETGIFVFRKILNKQPISSDMWAYAMKLAGIRVPMMGAKEESGSPWQLLANAIKGTQRELTVREVDIFGAEKSITAKEIIIQPSPEQRQVASNIVEQMLGRTKVAVGEI